MAGRGLFTGDVILPGMLYAAVLRSPHAHAHLVSTNAQGALETPGVFAAVTSRDVQEETRSFRPGRYAAGLKSPIPEYAIAVDKVRYVGEPVAAVAARSRAVAEDAIEHISVDYDPLPPVVETREAMSSPTLLFEELGSNVAWKGHIAYGDVEKAFRDAHRVVREQLSIHRYSSTPLEPFACVSSLEPETGRLTVWCNAQIPEVIYDALRETLGLENVRVLIPDVGGGFGQKIHLIRKYVVLVSLLSLKTGRPVQWVEDRTEHLMAAGHSCSQEFDVEAAVKKDGTVLGLRVKETDDVGGSVSTLTIHFTNKLNNLFNTYKATSVSLEGCAVVTNKCPVIPNRGIGKPGMCFIWERIMDRIAQELGLSPVEIRSRNLIRPEEFPYTTPSGNIYDSGNYPALLQRLLEKTDYAELRAQQARARQEERYLGIGLVMGLEPGGRNAARDMAIFPEMKEIPGAGGVNGCSIKLEKNGTISLNLAAVNCGQSHETTACQVTADLLGTSPEAIQVVSPFDSDLTPWEAAPPTAGTTSISTASGQCMGLRSGCEKR